MDCDDDETQLPLSPVADSSASSVNVATSSTFLLQVPSSESNASTIDVVDNTNELTGTNSNANSEDKQVIFLLFLK